MVDAQLRIMRIATAWSKFKEEKIEQASYDLDDDYDSDDYDSEDSDFLGFALSLVIAFNKDHPGLFMWIGCTYNFKTINGESHEINRPLHLFTNIGSSKLHQVYVWWSNNVLEGVVEGAQSPTAFYKLVTEVYVDFSVLCVANKPCSEEELEVEKCGICLLYAQDAESIK
ncbi:disease resistance protein RPS6 [Prunus yedoensis var. nudiflora]|uniref:Disease resistance protein RPS6 n=1 Tax=Prunus yedoensis var. nudiflora TaxID=2094558 RepID=A0A314ZEQ1_PRUYE|nr:disease resistance protein RPS6 [Prunus yedoensis var. nudiflora]